MKDRISLYPGRVKLNPVAGEANTFDMVRADQPTQEGTALNKANLLNDSTATGLHLGGGEPTPDLAFQKMMKNVQVNSYRHLDKAAWNWIVETKRTIGNIICPPAYVRYTNEIIALRINENNTDIYISTDFGKTFEKLNKQLIGTPIFAGYYNKIYYFVTSGKFYSTKDKQTFMEYDVKNVDSSGVNAATIDEDHGNLVFATTYNNSTFCYAPLEDLSNQKKINVSSSSYSLYNGITTPLSYCNGQLVKTVSFPNGYAGTFIIDNYWENSPKTTANRGYDNTDGYIRSKIVYSGGKYYYALGLRNNVVIAVVSDLHTEVIQDMISVPPINDNRGDMIAIEALNDGVYFSLIHPDTAKPIIYKIYNRTIEQVFNVDESTSIVGIISADNSGNENHVVMVAYSLSTWETYDKYIIEDYLTDISGEMLKLAANQIPIQIETGSYTGTGTYGSSNPNSLTFGFEPKLVIIYAIKNQAGDISQCMATFSPNVKMGNNRTYQYIYVANLYGFKSVFWSGKTLKWYTTSADYQLNAISNEYYYIAIG